MTGMRQVPWSLWTWATLRANRVSQIPAASIFQLRSSTCNKIWRPSSSKLHCKMRATWKMTSWPLIAAIQQSLLLRQIWWRWAIIFLKTDTMLVPGWKRCQLSIWCPPLTRRARFLTTSQMNWHSHRLSLRWYQLWHEAADCFLENVLGSIITFLKKSLTRCSSQCPVPLLVKQRWERGGY